MHGTESGRQRICISSFNDKGVFVYSCRDQVLADIINSINEHPTTNHLIVTSVEEIHAEAR